LSRRMRYRQGRAASRFDIMDASLNVSQPCITPLLFPPTLTL
jgi:hypothetical protein